LLVIIDLMKMALIEKERIIILMMRGNSERSFRDVRDILNNESRADKRSLQLLFRSVNVFRKR